MLSIKLEVELPEIDYAKWSAEMHEGLRFQMREAAKVFGMTVRDLVPVWSGEAAGSLKPLARALHFSLNVSPKTKYSGVAKGEAQGGSTIKDMITVVDGRVIFQYYTKVFHFLVNEQVNVNVHPKFNLKNPGPWRAFEAGREAALSYLQTNLIKGIPKIDKFVTVKKGIRHTPKITQAHMDKKAREYEGS